MVNHPFWLVIYLISQFVGKTYGKLPILVSLPGLRKGTILDSPFLVVEGMARIGFPSPSLPTAAPLMKSTCPPTPAIKSIIFN